MPMSHKISFDKFIREVVNVKHLQRLLPVGPLLGMLMILFFSFFLLPYFVAALIYGGVLDRLRSPACRCPPIYNFDRHRIAALRGMDQFWCEYCEWANGTLQWITALLQRDLQTRTPGRLVGFVLFILGLAVLLPYMLFFNRAYFWVRRQPSFPMAPYFRRARNTVGPVCALPLVALLGIQLWIAAIVHEIERRYCPVQNHNHPHCSKARQWRDGFLPYDFTEAQVLHYYDKRYLSELPDHEEKIKE